MNDYMTALHQRFYREPDFSELEEEIEQTHQEVRDCLDKMQRRRLMHLVDTQNLLREETSLASFTAGFKLAWGIARELEADGLYSFQKEEEQRACEIMEREGMGMAKKRANGEGSIRKRKDGRWEGRYTAGHDPETGKAIYKNVLGRTQAEVKEKLKATIKETQSLDQTKVGKYTVGEWMEVWFEDYAKIKVRPSSHQTYRGYIDNHINPNIGDIPLEKITSLELQKLYKKLLTKGRVDRLEAKGQPKGLSAKTVRNIHQILSSALKLAQEQRILHTTPAEGCALPKVEHREIKTLPVEQFQSFLREARESGVFELYYLELATGLRRGELLGLKWEDIDLERGDLRVRRQISRINGEVVEAPLKTKNAYRTLPLAEDTVSVLLEQKKKVGSSPWVFPSPNGGPISPDSVLHMLHRVLKRAGLPKVRFHDLRHTFATLALQNGVDIKTVSGMLGHFSAGFTLDTYAHVTSAAQRQAAQTMGNVLSGSL